MMGASMNKGVVVYRPTEAGAKVIPKSADRLLGGNELCFARRNVVEVTNWTEPADVMGVRVSQVRYRYKIVDIAPWAQTARMLAAFPRIAKALGKVEGEDKASLILTNEGWAHQRSLRN